MIRSARLMSMVALVVSAVMAGNPIATIVSGRGLSVRGVPLQSAGVPLWPLVDGDELATSGASAAVVMFKDQSRLTLEPNSRVKLLELDDSTCVYVSAGAAELSAVSGAKMGICGPETPLVTQTPFEGRIAFLAPRTISIEVGRGTVRKASGPPWADPKFSCVGPAAAVAIGVSLGIGAAAAIIIYEIWSHRSEIHNVADQRTQIP
jgi:hypothetical protein